jgi:hypothetical protein
MLDHARIRERPSLDGASNRLISPFPGRSLQFNYTQTGVAGTPVRMPNETAVYVLPTKEKYMKFRLYKSVYLLALLAAFVVASGAGHKFGG